tara:strand:+ start:952 stop:1455 length:504 start_codon:yes stop_codon:yes gene_type:complete
MSKYFFDRLEVGYKGEKTVSTGVCNLSYCTNPRTTYKGIGERLCEKHQRLMREYGGPGRTDRPYTFNKSKTCDCCGLNPWEHDMVKQIDDELIRDRTAWGMLIVDHIHTQRDGGSDAPENCQTLCKNCNDIKSTLAGDLIPKKLYKNPKDHEYIMSKLKPHYLKLFG